MATADAALELFLLHFKNTDRSCQCFCYKMNIKEDAI